MTLPVGRDVPGPHGNARIATAGSSVREARAAMVLCHGRGATAEDVLALAAELEAPDTLLVAPQADQQSWYPRRFVAPLRENEPYLSSALALLGAIIQELESEGIPRQRQLLLGFSQGGCLALEFAARNARRYGGVVGLSAGLIGPPSHKWHFDGSLDETPVFLGCGDPDPHIPRDRLDDSARELARLGGAVNLQLYPGLSHTINRVELEQVQRMLDRLTDLPNTKV